VKENKELKAELKRKAHFINKLVQKYWKQCEKIIKHNYNIEYE